MLVSPAVAENWPQWRGARHDGISREKNPPVVWSKTRNIAWRTPLPGPAGSTPIVWEKHIFLTSAEGERDLVLLALDTSGKLLWKQRMSSANQGVRGDEGNYASPSPMTDGQHVWAMMGSGDIGCYDFQGTEVWKFNLQDRYGKFKIAFGMSSTPVLDGDRIYVQLIHGEGNPDTREAMVVCLDKATGKEVWKADRPSDGRAECEHSYASPTLYRDDKREFLLTHGADYIVAHSLADGSELCRCGGLNPKGNYNPTLRFVASPLAVPGLIVVPSAKSGPVLGLSPDAAGDITDSQSAHLWSRRRDTPDVPSPLVVDGLLYLCRENGNLLCMDAKTGEEIYLQPTERDRHRASPVYCDGKIYLTARNGTVTVVKAGRKFEVLSSNKMEEAISSSPVFAGGVLYLRTFDALYAVPSGN
jgi:outer membrane protein assembly factor BamB